MSSFLNNLRTGQHLKQSLCRYSYMFVTLIFLTKNTKFLIHHLAICYIIDRPYFDQGKSLPENSRSHDTISLLGSTGTYYKVLGFRTKALQGFLESPIETSRLVFHLRTTHTYGAILFNLILPECHYEYPQKIQLDNQFQIYIYIYILT